MQDEHNKDIEEEKINPSDIIFEDEGDEDMPTPETEKYEESKSQKAAAGDKQLRLKIRFIRLFYQCIDKLPYKTVLKSENGEISLTDLVKYVDDHSMTMPVNDMNYIISFLANQPREVVGPLMELIQEGHQPALWTILN